MESIKNLSQEINKRVREKIVDNIKIATGDNFNEKIRNYSKKYLESLKINIIREFKDEDAEKLNSKPGLIISNHPSIVDAPGILSQIERNDLKIVVKEDLYSISPQGLKELFIPASKDPSKAKELIKETVDTIHDGGAVLLFPTGGREIDLKENNYHSGFRVIVNKLDPETMVFVVNVQVLNNLLKDKQMTNLSNASNLFFSEIPSQLFLDESEVQIRGKYTKAKDWQKIIRESKKEGLSSSEINGRLGDFYASQFAE